MVDKIKRNIIEDDAVTSAKIPNDAIKQSEFNKTAITGLTEETSPAGTSFVGLHTGSAYKKTKLTDIWSAGFTQQSHIVDAVTSHTVTDPADSPASADALRDDLVTNTIPSIESQLNALGVKINAVITALENSGITATS